MSFTPRTGWWTRRGEPLAADQVYSGQNQALERMVAPCEDIPPMVGQREYGQDGQEKEDGPDLVNDGPENAHEKG